MTNLFKILHLYQKWPFCSPKKIFSYVFGKIVTPHGLVLIMHYAVTSSLFSIKTDSSPMPESNSRFFVLKARDLCLMALCGTKPHPIHSYSSL